MSNVYYRLYRDNILAFAKTLVVKCSGVAETLNRELELQGFEVNPDRPETWKYYLNLAGEYHPSDPMIRVRSLDTLEDIDFTRSNLATHRATAREYRPGGFFHQTLIDTHPNQTDLIRGILDPVDMATALDAEDGTLLQYDESHIESNELSLVVDLQHWLNAFFARWYNKQYLLTDDLFLPGFLGVLYMQLPMTIQHLRLRRAKTPEAHSFHVREYLASNGGLDEYLPYLTKEQQLFLYRNLRYMNRNLGKQAIFDLLVNRLLTPRGVPVDWYKLEHNTKSLPGSIYPEVDVVPYPVNASIAQPDKVPSNVHTILRKERGIARENADVEGEAEVDIINRVRSGQFSRLPTKVLESTVVERSNSSVRSLLNVLLNHWVYLASQGRYRSYITVTHPVTDDLMSVSVKDAFLLMYYCFHKARNVEVDYVPRVLAHTVLRQKLPSFEELAAVVDQRYVPDRLITAVMDRISPMAEYITVEGFNEGCTRLHREYLKLWELYSFQEHYMTRGLTEQVVRTHFQHAWCSFVDEPTRFSDWLTDNGFEFDNFGRGDYEQIAVQCINNATGLNLTNNISFADVQQAMLELMERMSSYSVQYLRSINNSDFAYLGIPSIRVGDTNSGFHHAVHLNQGRTTVLHAHGRTRSELAINKVQTDPPTSVDVHEKVHLYIPMSVGVRLLPKSIAHVAVNVSDVNVRSFKVDVEHDRPTDGEVD